MEDLYGHYGPAPAFLQHEMETYLRETLMDLMALLWRSIWIILGEQ